MGSWGVTGHAMSCSGVRKAVTLAGSSKAEVPALVQNKHSLGTRVTSHGAFYRHFS